MLPMRRFPAAGLCLGVVTLGLVQELTFSLYRTSAWAVGQVASNGGLRGSHMARRAEAFDPFGLKGALKDTVEGLMDGLSGDEEPSQEEEQMVVEIFEKFDLDRDGVLNLKEFNELQMTTEGSEALYNADQLKSLLLAVNPDMEKPELGMPFADYRRLYLEGRMRRAYSTDLRKDYQKIFGADHKPVVTAEPVVDTVAVDPPAAAPAPAAPAPPAPAAPAEPPVVKRFPARSKVTIKGLTGAVELNGQEGEVVPPSPQEAELAAEGRVIVLLSDGDRVALRADNVRLKF